MKMEIFDLLEKKFGITLVDFRMEDVGGTLYKFYKFKDANGKFTRAVTTSSKEKKNFYF